MRDRYRAHAIAGKPPAGRRAFGFTLHRDGIVSHEADLIREAANRVLAGESLARVVRDWNARGLPGSRERVSKGTYLPTCLPTYLTE